MMRRQSIPGRITAPNGAGLLLTTVFAGCSGNQSVLDPAGPQAATISTFWWIMVAICTGVWLIVVVLFLISLRRARRLRRDDASAGAAALPVTSENRHDESGLKRAVLGGTIVTATILAILCVLDFNAGNALASIEQPGAITINITGNQFWWNVEYQDRNVSRMVTTANEIHIPVGQPIRFNLTSHDVIHSFWVPNLHGKKDLLPGYTTSIWIRADRAGIYRGTCAEFCGAQHAKMSLYVIAESPAQYAAWVEGQLRPASPPTDSLSRRGLEVFLAMPCPMCHSISGTSAGGRVAPDLSHVASRISIAAGNLPNTRGHLAGWIVDPQGIKPGNRMPSNRIAPDDLQALLVYLEGLK